MKRSIVLVFSALASAAGTPVMASPTQASVELGTRYTGVKPSGRARWQAGPIAGERYPNTGTPALPSRRAEMDFAPARETTHAAIESQAVAPAGDSRSGVGAPRVGVADSAVAEPSQLVLLGFIAMACGGLVVGRRRWGRDPSPVELPDAAKNHDIR